MSAEVAGSMSQTDDGFGVVDDDVDIDYEFGVDVCILASWVLVAIGVETDAEILRR